MLVNIFSTFSFFILYHYRDSAGSVSIDPIVISFFNFLLYGGSGDKQSPNTLGNKVEPDLQSPVVDPLHTQFLRRTPIYVSSSVASPIDSSLPKNQYGTLHGRFEGLPQAYLEALLSQQREQLELSLLGRSGGNCESYGNLSFGAAKVPHAGNPQVNSLLNSVGSGTHLFHNQRISQFNSMMDSSTVGTVGSWHTDNGSNPEGRLVSSLLDEFKNNKPKSFELSDIVNHVVEFRYLMLYSLYCIPILLCMFFLLRN